MIMYPPVHTPGHDRGEHGEILEDDRPEISMTEKEFRRLKRRDMLEIMLAQSREIDRLREELEIANAKLADRNIRIQNSGSIAEAALALTGIFEEAQKAADLYLNSIRGQGRYEEGNHADD